MGWTTISSLLFGVGKPITSAIGLALYENPKAIANGDSGAPRIFGQALAREGNGLTVLTVTAADTTTLTVGIGSVSGTTTNSTATEVVASTYTISLYAGTLRFHASHGSSSGTATLLLYKNGTLVSSFSTTSAGPVARTVDMSVSVGDVVEWRHIGGGGVGGTSTVFATSVTASDGWVPITPYALNSLL